MEYLSERKTDFLATVFSLHGTEWELVDSDEEVGGQTLPALTTMRRQTLPALTTMRRQTLPALTTMRRTV
jgi:hypothetical protein